MSVRSFRITEDIERAIRYVAERDHAEQAQSLRKLARLGFGSVEVGTLTPKPQNGNPKPRIFRLPADRGLINRLGFPSRGADFVAAQLLATRSI